MSRRGLLMAASSNNGGHMGEFFIANEIAEVVDAEVVCEGGCAFSVLIDDYPSAGSEVCGIYLIDSRWQLWLQHRSRGNLEIETVDGSEPFFSESVEDGAPHHIIVNADRDVIHVYVDGGLIGEQTGREFYDGGTIYRVGAVVPSRKFRVWNRFLSNDEIQAIYKADGR